jgi:hypothetical protein
MLGFGANERKERKPPTGRPLALDPFAESGSQTEPAFIARPAAGQDLSGRFLTNPTFKRFLHPKRSDGEFGKNGAE